MDLTITLSLTSILGMGGIGKTASFVQLVQGIPEDFDYVIWPSLRLAPTIEGILDKF